MPKHAPHPRLQRRWQRLQRSSVWIAESAAGIGPSAWHAGWFGERVVTFNLFNSARRSQQEHAGTHMRLNPISALRMFETKCFKVPHFKATVRQLPHPLNHSRHTGPDFQTTLGICKTACTYSGNRLDQSSTQNRQHHSQLATSMAFAWMAIRSTLSWLSLSQRGSRGGFIAT